MILTARTAGHAHVVPDRFARLVAAVPGGIEPLSHQNLAGGIGPELDEGGLERPRGPASHADHGVVPMIGVLRVAEPHVRERSTTGEAHGSVYHDRPAVAAPVEARERADPQGSEPRPTAAGFLEPSPLRARHLAPPEPVEENPH